MRKRLLLLYVFAIIIGAIGFPSLLALLQQLQWYEVVILSVVYSSLIVAGGLGLALALRKERREKKELKV
ncbi:MAG: hypothetical protein LZ158_02470 [Thaumarchaeota archaeon]|jgi:Trk-type K+ transport system membrane component|nr:hypothetical protein [Candidatus Terraquivivens yellowstonensis]MCL7392983.1 hypothetical protein [Candidatus Terraquivivens yellowstonensis]MCL7398002.1 hypothetical protein [Candidatus Terraquivivens yellowstonensis]MCL7400320.1 hypothetical protein [Candidatus Terraquivivens yellowstonensis]